MTSAQVVQSLTRRTIIDMALRRQKPGSGSAQIFLKQRTASMQWPDLSPVLAPIRWAVVGAAATRLYMPERFTQDFDVALAVQDAEMAYRQLSLAGYVRIGELSIGGSTWRAPDGQLIDVIEGSEPWWSDALLEAQSNRDAQNLPILPLSYLVLMKFNAGRTRDLGDIAQMLGHADDRALYEVRAVFRQYTADDLDDLESLILLGKLELDS
jgi:hypothetical protein